MFKVLFIILILVTIFPVLSQNTNNGFDIELGNVFYLQAEFCYRIMGVPYYSIGGGMEFQLGRRLSLGASFGGFLKVSSPLLRNILSELTIDGKGFKLVGKN